MRPHVEIFSPNGNLVGEISYSARVLISRAGLIIKIQNKETGERRHAKRPSTRAEQGSPSDRLTRRDS